MRVEQVIPSYIYKKEKYFAVNFTRIADGKQIILAIPYSMKGVPTNAIERTWLHKEYVPFSAYHSIQNHSSAISSKW